MFCTECGCSLVDGSKFCANCGTRVVVAEPVPTTDRAQFNLSMTGGFGHIKEALDKLKGLERVFVGKDIPDKKLMNAVKEYAKDVSPSDVLLLVDDTLFGNAKNGFLITPTSIYFHQMGMTPQCITLNSITSVALDKQKSVTNLLVNGVKVQSIGVSQESIAPIVEILNCCAQMDKATLLPLEDNGLDEEPECYGEPKIIYNKELKMKDKSEKNIKFQNWLSNLEEMWMEKNVINTYVIDSGGSVDQVNFRFEDDDEGDGYYLVCELEVEGIDSLPEDVEENILNEVEWAFDDIRSDLEAEGLDLDEYSGEKVLLKRVG